MYAEAAIKAGKHVFVEKPHAIDPVGVRRMADVCKLAEEEGTQPPLRACRAASTTAGRKPSSGFTTAPSATWWPMQSMFLRGPYRLEPRQPNVSEDRSSSSATGTTSCWLSGDDVPQSLVHNIDRMSWIMKEEIARLGLRAGRPFGLVRRGLRRHVRPPHGRLRVRERHPSVRPLPHPGRHATATAATSSWAPKGQCHLADCRITGETNWQFDEPAEQSLRGRTDGPDRSRPRTASRSTAASTWPTPR